jgi:multiple sugar transport system substrate-binding protein
MFKNKEKGGAIWAIPSFMSPSPLYYNKDIFDKFGVAYPKDGMTWDDVYELAKKVTRKDGDRQYYGLFLSIQHVIRRNQYSLNVIDPATETAAFNTDQWKKVFEQAAQFYKIPGMDMTSSKAKLTFQRDSFTKDRTVAMWLPVSTLHTEAELQGMNWDVATFPVYKDRPDAGPQPYPVGFFVTTSSKHKDEAFQVAAYMASEEYQLKWIKQGEFLTALKSDALRNAFGQDTAMYKGKNTKAMLPAKYASASAITKYNGDAEGQLTSAFTKIILNQNDINTALRDAEEATNKKIQEKKAAEK